MGIQQTCRSPKRRNYSMNHKFTFGHGGTENFDEHIAKSIRGYSNLLHDVTNLSQYFVDKDTNVVDIGCSTGNLLKEIITKNQIDCNYVGVEVEKGFHNSLIETEKDIKEKYPNTNLKFIEGDIRDFKFNNCSLITSMFTLQFLPVKDRADVIKKIYSGLNKGGCFIFAEKIICSDAKFQEMLTFNYYDYKADHFSADEILDKEKKLRSMLKPNTWDEIKNMLADANFKLIQPFWMDHVFVGGVAIKEQNG